MYQVALIYVGNALKKWQWLKNSELLFQQQCCKSPAEGLSLPLNKWIDSRVHNISFVEDKVMEKRNNVVR